MEYVLVTGMVIGLTELVKAVFDKNYRTAVIIVGAALIGAACGLFHVEGLDVPTGIVVGLAGSGLFTTAKAFKRP